MGILEAGPCRQAQHPAVVETSFAISGPDEKQWKMTVSGRPPPAGRRGLRRPRRGCGSSTACRPSWRGRCARRTRPAAPPDRRSRRVYRASRGPARFADRHHPRVGGETFEFVTASPVSVCARVGQCHRRKHGDPTCRPDGPLRRVEIVGDGHHGPRLRQPQPGRECPDVIGVFGAGKHRDGMGVDQRRQYFGMAVPDAAEPTGTQ